MSGFKIVIRDLVSILQLRHCIKTSLLASEVFPPGGASKNPVS